MIIFEQYSKTREYFISNPDKIIETERLFTEVLINDVIYPSAENILNDFHKRTVELYPFWCNYPPEQRGRQPIGNSIPWLELGEKTVSSNIIKSLVSVFKDINFAGLPTGGDIRFVTENVYVHLDIKMTGPNDNENEIVVPPNQVSGDGANWRNGIINNSHPIIYLTGPLKGQVNYHFQPKLPPIYILGGKPLLCLTFFLEIVYDVLNSGNHPLKYLELSCTPNGLIMFDTYKYANNCGLIIAGKDDNTKAEDTKRIRIRLKPLCQINDWRSIIFQKNGEWDIRKRLQ